MTRVQDAVSSHTGAHMPGAHMPARAELARDFLVAPLASDTDVSGSHTTVIRVGDDASPATPVPCVVAIGAFDGVHRGHLGLLSRARRDAAERGVAAIAVTFDPDPDEVVGKRPALKLLSIADRIKTLRASGTGVVVVPVHAASLPPSIMWPFLSRSSLRMWTSARYTLASIFALAHVAPRPSMSFVPGCESRC